MKRMFIDAPSKFNILHHMHGTKVLAATERHDSQMARVYFLEGDTISMSIPYSYLSEGWR